MERKDYYAQYHGCMLTSKSGQITVSEQLYEDHTVYVVKHRNSDDVQLVKVEYDFGTYFDQLVGIKKDNDFAVTITAYGSTLCRAILTFDNGEVLEQFRYISMTL